MAKRAQNRGDRKSPISKAAHAPVTHADVDYLKRFFPAHKVDAAIKDRDLVLIDKTPLKMIKSPMPASAAAKPPLYRTSADIARYQRDYGISPERIQQMKDDGDLIEIDELLLNNMKSPIPGAAVKAPIPVNPTELAWFREHFGDQVTASALAKGKIKIVDEQPTLYRTRADLERVAAREIPGVTPDLLEAMVHDGQIVLIDKPSLKKMRSLIPEAAATYPLTRQNIANIKRDFPMYAQELDAMIAEGEVSIIDEQKTCVSYIREIHTCKQCNRSIPSDANYCPYCAEPVGSLQTKRKSTLPVKDPLYRTTAELEEYQRVYGISPETIQSMKDRGRLVEIDEQIGNANIKNTRKKK
ncbi:zinc ribbon domain-containing protein [Methanoregula formicica]|uniref:Zinc-ribbon domain-containing protein n=1 Tax=Methanoregula formicica (strain DSM 22288 / NBRC 105244 / SMSP) TaxID=593750 RepID=L0HCE0_METFS|nr:zinc ribbon domain-containing protein [Methanoregula formicica]AGB02412.1 hypothetical protein Metfor_1373 [Methanoregula formicica SMSP]